MSKYDAIEIFAKSHKKWFEGYLELPNGIPSHDTFVEGNKK